VHCSNQQLYSITSSARLSSDGGKQSRAKSGSIRENQNRLVKKQMAATAAPTTSVVAKIFSIGRN
jgi:hypothetical protein